LAVPDSPSRAVQPRFLMLDEVAEELAVSRATMYTMLRSGELPAIQVGPKNVWRIERSKLEDFIAHRYAEAQRAIESGQVSTGLEVKEQTEQSRTAPEPSDRLLQEDAC
jgi:excisionase family DNA binding protein